MSELRISTIIFIASGALSFLSAPVLSLFLIPVARKIGAMDTPRDARRMHDRPIARIGGVAVFLAFLVGGGLFLAFCQPFWSDNTSTISAALIFGGTVIILGGLADDIYRLKPCQKMFYQILAAVVATAFGAAGSVVDSFGEIIYGRFGGTIGQSTASRIATVLGIVVFCFWCVLLTNSFNLIDGLDGLSSMSAAFCLLALYAMSGGELLNIILLCALCGFLPLNLRPARLFLGDAGAMLLGFSLSVLSSVLLGGENFTATRVLALILVFAYPMLDTLISATRRLLSGKSPFSPDRKHFHHLLVDSGLSHGRASLFLSLSSGGFSALGMTLWTVGFSYESLILFGLLIFSLNFGIITSTRKIRKKNGEKSYEKG